MLQKVLFTTWKDIKILFKDISGIATLFLMPLMFIIVMSTALQGMFDSGTDTQPRVIPVVNLDNGEYADQVISALEGIDGIELIRRWEGNIMTRETAETIVSDGVYPMAVLFPADFSRRILERVENDDVTVTVEFITDPAASVSFMAPIRGMVLGAAERVAETQIAQARVVSNLENVFAEIPVLAKTGLDQFSLEIEAENVIDLKQVAPAEMNIETEPDTYQQNVPGYTVLGVFFIVGAMASSILSEKREGTFRRLLVAPIARPVLLLGKILPYFLVNLIQIGIMFGVAHLLFDMTFGDPLALLVISMALAASATGLGIMIAALVKTDTQTGGVTSLLTLTMSALGGCLVPIYIMPDFLQTFSRFIPHTWAMQGFQDVLVRGYGVEGILNEVGILLAFAITFFLIAAWRFRFE